MSEYSEAVERGLAGLTFVSVGVCPGCDACRADAGFEPHESFTVEGGFIVKRYGEDGPRFSTEEACEAACRMFADAVMGDEVESEPSFSWSSCGICGSHLGGDREVWHAVFEDASMGDDILHFNDACVDCVIYIANGDEPEHWEG